MAETGLLGRHINWAPPILCASSARKSSLAYTFICGFGLGVWVNFHAHAMGRASAVGRASSHFFTTSRTHPSIYTVAATICVVARTVA